MQVEGNPQAGAPAEPGESVSVRARRFDLARTIALSDGIFAFALTLLVLSITVPVIGEAGSARELARALDDRSTELISWLISFAVIAMFWVRHNALTRRLVSVDGPFIVLNFVFLALVALVPYPTELLGRYPNSTSFSFYAIVISLLVISNAVAGDYAITHRLTGLEESPAVRRARLVDSLAPAAVFLVSIPVAIYAGVVPGYLCWVAVGPVNAFTGRRAARIERSS